MADKKGGSKGSQQSQKTGRSTPAGSKKSKGSSEFREGKKIRVENVRKNKA